MNSVEILAGSNQTEFMTGQNTIDLPGGGLFQVNITWYFLSPNFPVCVYEEVALE